jgi:tetratricopeptide (TPR) repeat protein
MKSLDTARHPHRIIEKAIYILATLCSLLFVHASLLNAQNVDAEVTSFLSKIENGQTEQAKNALPDLIAKYPNNPGVVYLQGKLTPNGIEAAKIYQSIVDNFPKSEWADDALFALYQYYYALGLYKTADIKLQQLKREYPTSQFASGKQSRDVPYLQDEVVKLPTKEVAPAETTRQSVPEVQPVPEPYTLQVGAYSTLKNAEKQKTFFEDIGVNVEITNKVRSGRSLYLVWAGSFTSSDEAKAFGKQIRQKYKIDSIVVEKY